MQKPDKPTLPPRKSNVNIVCEPTPAIKLPPPPKKLNTVQSDPGMLISQKLPPTPNHLEKKEDASKKSKIISKIESTSESVTDGISFAGRFVSKQIHQYGEKKKDSFEQTDNYELPAIVKKGFEYGHKGATAIGDASWKFKDTVIGGMGKSIAKSLKEENKSDETKPESESMKNTKQVAMSGIKGIGKILTQIVDSTKTVVVKGHDTTCDVIGYRYGEDTAEVSKHSVGVVTGSVQTISNISSFANPESIIIATGLATVKSVAFDEDEPKDTVKSTKK